MSKQTNPVSLITDNIDIWSSAIQNKKGVGRGDSKKINLYGIKKLRELILDLAVRGLLVEQNPNDEPVSVLLGNFYAKKDKLVKDKRIKQVKGLSDISDEEVPFTIPQGWKIKRLGYLSHVITKGTTPTSVGFVFTDSGVNFIKIENVSRGKIQHNTISHYITDETNTALSRSSLQSGDILFSIAGTIGKTCIVYKSDLPANTNQALAIIRGTSEVFDAAFLMLQLDSFVAEKTRNKARGGAMPNVSLGDLTNLISIVPPLAEQNRIVTKVNELMTLCDQLEQQQENSITAHKTLVETLLAALTNAANKGDFEAAWKKIADHFDTLFTTEHSIDQLKQTILQLAVMGKLVPQNPNDEPASVLLEKIAAEKELLVKDKKIKKHPAVEPIGKSIKLPCSWTQIVVQDFADIRLGSTPSRAEPKYWNGVIPWVSSGEVASCVIKDTDEKITQEGFENSSTSVIPARSLLMAIIGQGKTRGQTALLGIDACTNQNVAAFVFNEELVVPEYVWIWAQSKYDSHRGDGHGGAQPALNGKKVRSFRFPLPPTNEQQHIVAKVNKLFSICDSVNIQIKNMQNVQMQLSDVISEQVLN